MLSPNLVAKLHQSTTPEEVAALVDHWRQAPAWRARFDNALRGLTARRQIAKSEPDADAAPAAPVPAPDAAPALPSTSSSTASSSKTSSKSSSKTSSTSSSKTSSKSSSKAPDAAPAPAPGGADASGS